MTATCEYCLAGRPYRCKGAPCANADKSKHRARHPRARERKTGPSEISKMKEEWTF